MYHLLELVDMLRDEVRGFVGAWEEHYLYDDPIEDTRRALEAAVGTACTLLCELARATGAIERRAAQLEEKEEEEVSDGGAG